MQVRVTKIGKSSKGRPIAYFDGRHGQTDGFLVGNKCTAPQEGMLIEPDTSSSENQGKTYWWLNDWKPIKDSPAQAVGAAGRSAVVDAPKEALKGWDVLPGDLSRFVSNVIGSAITAGLIKEPSDIRVWSRSAYRAAQSMREGFTEEEGPDPSTHAGEPDRDDFDDRSIPF